MRTYSEVCPESWYCEECEDFIKQSSLNIPGLPQCGSSHPIGLPNDLRLNSINRGKKIQTGKVKYISPQEVIMLESGSPSSIRHKNRSMSNLELVSGNPSLEHSEQMRPPTAYQQVTGLSGGLGGGAVSSNLEIERADPMSIISLCARPMNDESVYTPASDASWRGSFNVLLRDPKNWEVSCGVQAHPASRVRRKVYESARLMPEVLECELVQRGSLWMSLFESHCLDRRDIGLYFFPSNPERCKNYVSLLQHMGKQDLVLRKYLGDGCELLIFTSQILPMDCQRWNGKYFLWGVFRHTKLAITSIPEEECPEEGNNNEVADMEIDMKGGGNV